MKRIFAIHEYELRHDTDSQEFESVLKNTLLSKELDMPGLESRHLLKGYKGERKSKYLVLWIFKSQEALEELFGIEEKSKRGPVNFVNFEDNILSKFLDRPADKIVFTDYWELASRGLPSSSFSSRRKRNKVVERLRKSAT
jgi:heme-degrading monooxygenase HmoA